MQNTLHYTALQLAGRVSAALRGGEGSEVELETGAVWVLEWVFLARGCGTCLCTVSTCL